MSFVARATEARHVGRHLPALALPLRSSAIQNLGVRKAEQPEDPERVRRPPIVLVAVEDDCRRFVDALAAEQLLELLATHIITHDGIVQIGMPIDFLRTRDMPSIEEEDILIALDDVRNVRGRN